jgi:ABC-2 type transport system permease protein
MISGLSPTSGVAMAVGQILNFSQMFISDLIIPIQFLPDWLQKASNYFPGFAIVQLVRPTLTADIFSPELWSNLFIVAVYILVSGVIAVRFFRWSPAS